jgi:hypothetical protein
MAVPYDNAPRRRPKPYVGPYDERTKAGNRPYVPRTQDDGSTIRDQLDLGAVILGLILIAFGVVLIWTDLGVLNWPW